MSSKSLLFTPIRFGNIEAKNRICISAMSQSSAVDGFATDWHLIHYGARAVGGAGIVMVEATAVEARGRVNHGDTGIWSDAHVEPLKRITEFVKLQNSIPGIQLAHAGRKAGKHYADGWQTIGPSPIPFNPQNDQLPHEATLADIHSLRQSFVDGAKRALKAGFEIIELHFAHGYLVHQFLSSYSNKRTDQYGGSFENRIRFALEIVQDLKYILPENFPMFVRISCTDYLNESEGWGLKQSIELSKRLKQLGVSLVDCSSGGMVWDMEYKDVDQIVMAETIQREANLPTGAVGGIVNPEFAEQILQKNRASLIFIGRISLENPNWPIHAAAKLNAKNVPNYGIPGPYSWAIGEKTSGNWRQVALVEQNFQQISNGL